MPGKWLAGGGGGLMKLCVWTDDSAGWESNVCQTETKWRFYRKIICHILSVYGRILQAAMQVARKHSGRGEGSNFRPTSSPLSVSRAKKREALLTFTCRALTK